MKSIKELIQHALITIASLVGVASHSVWYYGYLVGIIRLYLFSSTVPTYFTANSTVKQLWELFKYYTKAFSEALLSTTGFSKSSSCWHPGRCLSSRSLHPDTNSPGHRLVAVSQDWQATSHAGEGGSAKSFMSCCLDTEASRRQTTY